MYFGSVKFFKHLIVGVPLLILLVSLGLSIYFGIENGRKNEEIVELQKQLALSGADGADEPSAQILFELYKDAEDKDALLKLISDYDGELYASFAKEAFPAFNDHTQSAEPSDPTGTPARTGTPAETKKPDGTTKPSETKKPEGTSPTAGTTTTTGTTATTTTTTTQTRPRVTASLGTTRPTTTTTRAPFITTTHTSSAQSAAPAPGGSQYAALYPDLCVSGTDGIVYNADMDYIYLTFDDGPSKYTENILYYLDKHGIKATFFVVPDGSETSNARLKKIADAGHTIGIHSATHEYNKIYASVEAYLEDFKTAYDRVYAATGVKCELFRFPGGSINDFNGAWRDEIIAEMTRRGFIYFDWNVDSGDAAGATWTEMYTGVLNQIEGKNRAVVLMHDHGNGYNTVLVLEDIINALLNDERGFKLDRLTKNVKPVQF